MRRKKWQSKLCGGFLAVLTVYLYLQFSKLCIKNIFFTENSDDSKIPLDSFLSDSLVSEKNVNLDLDQKEHAKNGQTLLKHNKGETKNSDGVDEKVLGDSSKNSNASNGLSCQELKALLKATKLQNHSQLRHENDIGNRGVYFSKIIDERGKVINVVLKVATIPALLPLDAHFYRYKTALKEIETLQKLEKLNWNGVPKFYGACVSSMKVIYAVKRIYGTPICRGFGTSLSCVLAKDLKAALTKTKDSHLSTMIFLSKVACFFSQFQRDKVFMEDLTGSNLFYEEKTFDIYLVDADSLIFYGDHPINSGASCKSNHNCPNMPGNFWEHASLNRKIYSSCHETKGNCVDYVCGGFDASLHACGIGHWMFSSLRDSIPTYSMREYREVIQCMTQPMPKDRCSLSTACAKLTDVVVSYMEWIRGGHYPADLSKLS